MLFNTLDFWLFYVVVLASYSLLARRSQNLLLLAASYFFYACWDWRFLSLLLVSTTADWLLANAIRSEPTPSGARRWVAASVTLNLLFLGFFKYFNFFVDSADALMAVLGLEGLNVHLEVVLPVGISFYTFQSMSYIVDVYRGDVEPARDPVDFALFVAFFPHMVAGPIMRSRDLLPQMQRPRRMRWAEIQSGFHVAMIGLFKKVVIADNLAAIADPIFERKFGYRPGVMHLGALAFAFQIYCDFSGYSDIARGVARIMGFRLMENFNFPYFSSCITDFWRRWHISLSSWLRDYLYVPLGGNRDGASKTARNLALTMLLGGLWHGAAWNFVLWGGYHGLLLALERALGGRRLVRHLDHLRGVADTALWTLRVVVTFHLVCLGWVLFRAPEGQPLWRMVVAFADPTGWLRMPAEPLAQALVLIVPFVSFEIVQFLSRDEEVLRRVPAPLRGLAYAGLGYVFVLLGRFESNAFIYFQF